MQIGMRAKLVALLTLVALLPLLAATITIVVGVQNLRQQSFGERLAAAATNEARSMRVALTKDVEKLLLVLSSPDLVSRVAECNTPLPQSQRERLDAEWPTMPESNSVLAQVLGHPLAKVLGQLQQSDRRLDELMITDRYGQLIAASERTTDYYQADEDWWQKAFDEGKGRIYIERVSFDESSQAWTLNICLPIMKGPEAVGVAKMSLDVSQWIGEETHNIGEFTAQVMLLRPDGTIIYRRDVSPLSMKIADPQTLFERGTTSFYRMINGEIQAFAPLAMPGRIASLSAESPPWILSLYFPQSQPMQAVTALALRMLAVGVLIILAIFFAGLFLVDRSMTRRIRRLAQATRQVAKGDLTHRIRTDWPKRRFIGRDEIDELAADFDNMIDRVQQSHEALQGASELKTRFINIASHELRTPVSYILGMTRLLKDATSAERLQQAMQSIAGKAKRLDDIIHAMFKLLPDQRYRQELRYGKVVISEMLEEVYLDVFPFIERRGQRLVIQLGEQTPDIQADRDKVRDMIENLVMNAVKFTPDGGTVTVGVGLELGGFISITVHDQGPGIPAQDLPHIFEPFFTGGDVLQHSTAAGGEYQKRGMGLGLAIVRAFAQMHGGSVNVTTSPKGATFTITIPIETPPPAQRPQMP